MPSRHSSTSLPPIRTIRRSSSPLPIKGLPIRAFTVSITLEISVPTTAAAASRHSDSSSRMFKVLQLVVLLLALLLLRRLLEGFLGVRHLVATYRILATKSSQIAAHACPSVPSGKYRSQTRTRIQTLSASTATSTTITRTTTS